MAKSKATKGDTYVRRRYRRLAGKNYYTWSIVVDGRERARSFVYRTAKSLDAAIVQAHALLGAVVNRP